MVLVHSVPTCRASKVTAETGSGPFYVCTVMLQIRKKQKMLDSLSRIFFVSKATEKCILWFSIIYSAGRVYRFIRNTVFYFCYMNF